MFNWQSEDTKDRLMQLKILFAKVHFRISIDNLVKFYGIDKKHKEIVVSQNLLENSDCAKVNQLIKEIAGKKFVQNLDQGK